MLADVPAGKSILLNNAVISLHALTHLLGQASQHGEVPS